MFNSLPWPFFSILRNCKTGFHLMDLRESVKMFLLSTCSRKRALISIRFTLHLSTDKDRFSTECWK